MQINNENKKITAADFMLAELTDQIKQELSARIATRILQHHLGMYELEEGEIIEYEWSIEEIQSNLLSKQ